jgi:hypothetical protein
MISGIANRRNKLRLGLSSTKIQKYPLIERLKEILRKFNPKEFFKFGLARFLHYTNSLFAIIVSTVYIIMTAGTTAIISTVLLYVAFIVVGLKTDGVYNPDYSLDTNNSTWTFNMEVVCFISLFTYVLAF